MRIEILLKEIRIKKGYSLERLARTTGISSSHLNYIEKNEKEPSLYGYSYSTSIKYKNRRII